MAMEIKFSYMWCDGNSWVDNRHTLSEIEGGDQYDCMSDSPLLRPYRLQHRRQFTGQCDQSSREIYEGDIAEFTREDGTKFRDHIIQFSSGEWMLSGRDPSRVPVDSLYYMDAAGISYEVIGNIHENPELLEQIK